MYKPIDLFSSVDVLLQFNKGGKGGGGGGGQRQNWQDLPRANAKLENYYNVQGFIPEEEREIFWETLRKDLPNSFRFTGSKGYAYSFAFRFGPALTSFFFFFL